MQNIVVATKAFVSLWMMVLGRILWERKVSLYQAHKPISVRTKWCPFHNRSILILILSPGRLTGSLGEWCCKVSALVSADGTSGVAEPLQCTQEKVHVFKPMSGLHLCHHGHSIYGPLK